MPISNPALTENRLEYVELLGGEDYVTANSATWDNWDLSAIIGAGAKYVNLYLMGIGANGSGNARKNGSALAKEVFPADQYSPSTLPPVECDASRIIEVYATNKLYCGFNVAGYWRPRP